MLMNAYFRAMMQMVRKSKKPNGRVRSWPHLEILEDRTLLSYSSFTSLMTSMNPAVFARAVTFTASVVGAPQAGSDPTGTVTFLDGGVSIDRETLDVYGDATFTTSSLSVATHMITAVYSGDTVFRGSGSRPLAQKVLSTNTATTLTNSLNPTVFGQPLLLTATVSPVSTFFRGIPTGTVTFSENGTAIGTATLNPPAPVVDAQFPTPSSLVIGITTGPDGNLWFADEGGNIGRITTAGTVTEFAVPTPQSELWDITAGPDGNLWFTEINGNKIGRITTSGAITEFSLPPSSTPVGITSGPGGNLWFAEAAGSIGEITPLGSLTQFSIPTASAPDDVVTGPDGNLWFTDGTGNIGRMTTLGTVAEFPIPTTSGRPTGITVGPDGNLWFTEEVGNRIGRITTSGTVSEFSIPTGNSRPENITVGLDGNLWFTESNASRIGRITTSGAVSEISVPSGSPEDITAGPDGNLWFSGAPNNIGRVRWSPQATFGTNSLPGGTDSITATYNGDACYAVSTSAALGQTVNGAATATTVTTSVNPSVFGQAVTITATVNPISPATGIPPGTVSFFENGTPIGTANLNPPASFVDAEYPPPTGISGVSDITAGPDGNSWFTEANANKIGRISPAGAFTEFAIPTFSSGPGGITTGPDGNLWFTEHNGNQIGRITPSGSVTEFAIPTAGSQPVGITTGPDGSLWFTEIGANKIGRITTSGTVTEFTVPTPSSSPQGITAGTDGNLWFTETAADNIGRITPSGSVSEFFALTASVHPERITAGPDGNLWFTSFGADRIGRITPAGTVTLFSVPTAGSGVEDITLGPDGDLWFTELYGNQIGRITAGGTVTEFSIPTAGSEPHGIATGPDGNLWFAEVQANKIGRLRVSPEATLITSSLPAGTDLITATYNGDANFNSSTSPATSQTVNPTNSLITLTASVNQSVFGQFVTFTASVSPGSPGAALPTGTVTFLDGGTSMESGTLSGGTATFATSSLSVGAHAITATYSGDANFIASSSTAISQTVTRATTITTVTTSVNPSVFGQFVTFTATVSAVSPGAGVITGAVTVRDGGTSIGSGTLANGTVTIRVSSLSIGTHTITASYGGDANFSASASATTSQTVHRAGTATSVTSSVNPSVFGQGVIFTATVSASSAGGGTPTGTVSFLDGAASIGRGTLSSGTATFSTTSLSAGTHTITAIYGGDANFNSSTSSILTERVSPPPSITSLSQSSANEGSTAQTLMVNGTGFAGATVDWNGTPLTTNAISSTQLQATIPAADLAEEGSASLTVVNSDGTTSPAVAFTVRDNVLTLSGVGVITTTGLAFSGTVAVFTDADPNGSVGDYSATITWGAGRSSPGTVTTNAGGSFNVGGANTYAAEGRYNVRVTITDRGGSQATATGLAHVARTGAAPLCLTIVAGVFAHSAEYYSHFVTAAYQKYLGRTPSATELAGWVSAMQAGLTDEQLEAGFIGAPEYIASHGGAGAGWVRGMYLDLLNRTPSDAEVNGWLLAIQNGETETAVAYGFAASPEREGIRVQADYQKYLGRAASAAEVNGWIAAFESHSYTNEDVIAGFVGSPEFFQTHYDNIADWLFAAYGDVLGRLPDAAGYAAWLAYLRNA
jgi:streptogramin lyase